MDYTALAAEIGNDPTGIGYAGSDVEIADALNLPRAEVATPYYVNARSMLAVCGLEAGSGVLAAIQATMPVVYDLLMQAGNNDGSAGGVDVSLDSTRAAIDALVAGGAMAAEHAATLKGLGRRLASRAEVLGLGSVHHLDVARAMRG